MDLLAYFTKTSLAACLLVICLFCSMNAISEGESIVAGIDQQRIIRLDNKLTSYLEQGRYAGFTGLIVRNNQIAHQFAMGWQDRERKVAMANDTIFRIFSLSKAITAAAAMTLFEEGHFQIDDPIDRFLPELKQLRVLVDGQGDSLETEPLARPMTFRDLLTHTSGFTYHFMGDSKVHRLYRERGIMPGVETVGSQPGDARTGVDLESMVTELAGIPLLHQPGAKMSYGVSIDVLGRLIEVISGESLDAFLRQKIFEPLKMTDTGFQLPENKMSRFAGNYSYRDQKLMLIDDPYKSRYLKSGRVLSGGAGLVSTAHDYMQFLRMMLNGGKSGDTRILGPKTIDFMFQNHFPQQIMERPGWMKQGGHGLGFALAIEPVMMGMMSSVGTAEWASVASSFFWIDREEDLAAILMTQETPLKTNTLIEQTSSLTYQAIVSD